MATTSYEALLLQDGAGSTAELGLKVSEKILPKLFEVEGYLRGYMVDGTYEAEAQNVASIVIPVLARPTGHFENMKSGYNPFEAGNYRMEQSHIQLDVDREYRQQLDISEDQLVQNIIGGSVVTTLAGYVAGIIGEEINRFTANGMVKGANEYNSEKAAAKRKISYVTLGTTVIPNEIAKLKAKIGNADPAHGDTSFNSLPISAVISNELEAELLKTQNQFILESSYGQEILVEGSFGRITLSDNNAYRGKILGVNIFVLADGFFPNEDADEGLFEDKPTAGRVLGVLSVPVSTYRVFVDKGMKTVDAVAYRGIKVQPLYRLGLKVAKPWGIGLLVSDDYVDANLQAADEFAKVEFEAGTSTAGDTKIKTLTLSAANGFLYKKGNQPVVYHGAYANGTDSWATATAGTTVISGCTAGDEITIVAVDASGKAIAKAVHKLVATEIKAS